MNRGNKTKRALLMLLVMVLGLSMFTSCASIRGETAGEYIDDSTITTEVHAMILKDPDAHYLKVDVTTTQGDVVLQGFINKRETEHRLVAKIKTIRGVNSVKSLLRVEEKR